MQEKFLLLYFFFSLLLITFWGSTFCLDPLEEAQNQDLNHWSAKANYCTVYVKKLMLHLKQQQQNIIQALMHQY